MSPKDTVFDKLPQSVKDKLAIAAARAEQACLYAEKKIRGFRSSYLTVPNPDNTRPHPSKED